MFICGCIAYSRQETGLHHGNFIFPHTGFFHRTNKIKAAQITVQLETVDSLAVNPEGP
jgi:hypothetical protein